MALRIALLAGLPCLAAGSLYLAEICRGVTCEDPAHPLVDYDPEQKLCECRSHPCWDDDGQEHACEQKTESGELYHLSFAYTEDKTLVCSCQPHPHYSSVYVARELCPGHHCDTAEHPILDWDAEKKECHCRAHPCEDLDGHTHECTDPEYPLLRYREEHDGDEVKSVCECLPRLTPSHDPGEL